VTGFRQTAIHSFSSGNNAFSSFVLVRVVKRSSDLRTSNFKFEFVFVFQPFDIRIQASLIRRRRFCLESGALLLQRALCEDFFVLCRPSIQATPTTCLLTPSLPAYRRGVQLLSVLHCALGKLSE